MSGLGIYLAYVFFLVGNPFTVTYSKLDQEFAVLHDVIENFQFYFINMAAWFYTHAVILLVLWFVSRLRGKQCWFWFAVILSIFNYTFYLLHKVQIDYYPYATALVSLGLVIGVADIERLSERLRTVLFVCGIVVCVLIVGTSRIPRANPVQEHAMKIRPYQTAFFDHSVVWAELRTGTVEYSTGSAGFRYNWGPDAVRKYILLWLRDRGYTQAIWVDDGGMVSLSEVEHFLSSNAIEYKQKSDKDLGTYLEISSAGFRGGHTR